MSNSDLDARFVTHFPIEIYALLEQLIAEMQLPMEVTRVAKDNAGLRLTNKGTIYWKGTERVDLTEFVVRFKQVVFLGRQFIGSFHV